MEGEVLIKLLKWFHELIQWGEIVPTVKSTSINPILDITLGINFFEKREGGMVSTSVIKIY